MPLPAEDSKTAISTAGAGSSSSESSSDPEHEYYFESDPLVLKNNPDYQQLLRCQLKLHSQRTIAVKSLEHLLELWDYGIKNPMKFVEDFSSGRLHLPEKITVEELPSIEWSKYNLSGLNGDLRRNTRKRVAAARAAAKEPANGQQMVRGRPYDASKPQSFNQPWTAEEQRRLDELLIIFPPEDIAANRYRKIAEELGTRSSIQVQSRVQKYSIALRKNKIALPGYRAPSRNVMRKQSQNSSFRRRSTYSGASRSIFMAPHDMDPHIRSASMGSAMDWGEGRLYPKVEHSPYGDDPYYTPKQEPGGHSALDMCESQLVSEDLVSDEQVRLAALRRIKTYKLHEQRQLRGQHYTYTCFSCKSSPIEGVRYHCLDCRAIKQEDAASRDLPGSDEDTSVDYCRRCHERATVPPSDSAAAPPDTPDMTHNAAHTTQLFHWLHLKKTLPRIIQCIKSKR